VTTKQKVLEAVHDLPDDASIEDAIQRLVLLAKIDRGIQQADAGQTISHAQVREKMAKWLK
jgi:predicted transcriptional regulator